MKSVFVYDYPIGAVGIAEENGSICRVFFAKEKTLPGFSGFETAETPLIRKTAMQLAEYFGGRRKYFDLPLTFSGTDFQNSVWNALRAIPFGKTSSYQEIAATVGRPKASRAVGMANHRNPLVIIVPCHRVIGQNGSLTGYGGGLPVKEYLLELERR
ncbi:MAG: methylated-DNA--[protein]-cysteine S-methyltransferase [Clostridium sp.]|jgi:methylated-DNA-[protein]-cysteine S-methyltransferase|nr:methylated-DNA--[protein]-cysteine S-methyltransferase [Clostridium sp.]